ncbi:MAG: hypothetical protein JWQ43_1046 [Glaciihabitans sp.]|nr:hypothetical protein [Glaciihabitans sp.]
MKRARIIFQSVAVAAVILGVSSGVGFGVGPAAATSSSDGDSVDNFRFASYSGDYYLERAADDTSRLTTVETFVAQFDTPNQNRGIIRAIPSDYDGVALNPRVQSVVDEDGVDVPYEEESSNGFLELALGTDEYVLGATTYTITYTQDNVVRFFEDTNSDEFYWDTNGVGFAQPFGSVSARVHIDPELVPALSGNTACYVGPQGSTDTCTLEMQGEVSDTVFSATEQGIGPEENVTVVVGFAPGTFDIPEPPKPAAWAIVLPLVLMIITGLVAIGAIVTRVVVGRDHRGRGIIVPQYSVPTDTNLLLGSDLVKRGANAVAATFVSLAVRGNLVLADEGKDYSLRFVTTEGMDDQEIALLTALFDGSPSSGDVKKLGKPETALAGRIKKVTDTSRGYAITRRWRARPNWVAPVALLFVSLGLFVLSLLAFIANLVWSPAPSAVGLAVIVPAIVGVLVGIVCAVPAKPLTEAGAERRDYIIGLRDYLALAEADRFRVLQSPDGAERINVDNQADIVKLYEKLLPWAVLWGVEKQWAKELAVKYETTSEPTWYVGSSGFNAAVFSASMSGFRTSATKSATPVYTSSGGGSGSGGSFGGGFSGGGGGGGGGGGR